MFGALVCACCWIAAPEWTGPAVGIAVAAIATLAALRWRSLRLDVAELDRRNELDGWLRTWSDPYCAADRPARAWLEALLEPRLLALDLADPGSRLARLARRPARVVLLALLILLLLRLLWLPPLPAGVLPLGGRAAAVGGPGPTGEGLGGPGTATAPAGADAGPVAGVGTAAGGAERPTDAPGPRPGEATSSAAPQPYVALDLPVVDAFAVPELLEEAIGGDGSGTVEGAGGRTDHLPALGGDAVPGPPDAEDFERAREAALRSRHVRAEEREAVRRWFDEFARRRR